MCVSVFSDVASKLVFSRPRSKTLQMQQREEKVFSFDSMSYKYYLCAVAVFAMGNVGNRPGRNLLGGARALSKKRKQNKSLSSKKEKRALKKKIASFLD